MQTLTHSHGVKKKRITRTHLWRTSISSSPLSSPCLCSSAFLHPVEENHERSLLHMYTQHKNCSRQNKNTHSLQFSFLAPVEVGRLSVSLLLLLQLFALLLNLRLELLVLLGSVHQHPCHPLREEQIQYN